MIESTFPLHGATSFSLPERCRPGLRYGDAPERSREHRAPRTRFESLVVRARGTYTTLLEKRIAKQFYKRLESRISELNDTSAEMRGTSLARLREQIDRDGHNGDSLLTALAHACVTSEVTLGLIPREGQCRVARAMLFGLFVELPTGEGKTLSTALAAAVTAMDGTPVHVLTANDYLAERDATRLAPFYAALGLSSAFVRPDMSDNMRRAAYACDITHLTGKQAGFDWMRDALAQGPNASPLVNRLGQLTNPRAHGSSNLLQRGLCVGILDEADSMLLDEARTPLVLASPMMFSNKFESESSIALGLAQMLSSETDYQLNHKSREATLTDKGMEALTRYAQRVPGAWRANRYRNERVRQALVVLHLWKRDHDYIVRDGQIVLVDEQSGRALPDRRLQNGLHSLLELKERCQATPENETVASVAFQSFFLRYIRLVGTSGTLSEVSSELAKTYGASMVCVPAGIPSRLTILPPRVFASHADQLDALIVEVCSVLATKRPILIGTRSVEQSRAVSAMLTAHNVQHNVLNASQDRDEAAIISEAGQLNRVTVATNMAGRGTDIPLSTRVAELGGLHLVSLAFNDARRIDRQLIGRTARQGDPGSFRQLWALDDSTIKAVLPAKILKFCLYVSHQEECKGVARNIVLMMIRFTQRRIEWRHSLQRRTALAARKDISRYIALNGHPEHPA